LPRHDAPMRTPLQLAEGPLEGTASDPLVEHGVAERTSDGAAREPGNRREPRGGEEHLSALVDVLHFADPGCPWDYSAEPVRIGLEQRYGEQLRWRTVQVGLHESAESMEGRGLTGAALTESLRRFERFGMPFCTREPIRPSGTWAAARLVKAAELQDASAASALLRRLRLARFVEGRRIDRREELLALAAEIEGLDVVRLAHLAADFDDSASHAALRADMALARRPDRVALALEKTAQPPGEPVRFTIPTYVFHAHGRSATVPGFQPLEAYEVALHNLAPDLERRPPVDVAAFLRTHPGEPFASVEVAAATRTRHDRTESALRELAASAPVRRIAAGEGELWAWGPPDIELACGSSYRQFESVDRALAA
jgi:predicted DsbA family dithiol-disulfide isomerase